MVGEPPDTHEHPQVPAEVHHILAISRAPTPLHPQTANASARLRLLAPTEQCVCSPYSEKNLFGGHSVHDQQAERKCLDHFAKVVCHCVDHLQSNT
jgi:hypothetical protein